MSRAYEWVVRGVRFILRQFFRRVEVTGLENLPEHGGGILVSWHPNGLMDPALILAHFPRQVVFGARHGLFKWPVLGHVMKAVGTVPVYRAMDAGKLDPKARRAANAASLDALAERVAEGSFSCLFPEGDSHDAPHLLELKTGAARFFYRARELQREGGAPPVIIPVGLHYDAKHAFRSSALVAFHPPIRLPQALLDAMPAPPVEQAQDAEAAAAEVAAADAATAAADASAAADAATPSEDGLVDRVRVLTAEIDRVLREVVHATESWEVHHLMHRVRKLVRAERAARAGASLRRPGIGERTLAFARVWAGYHIRLASHPEQVAALRARITEYDADMRALRIEDHELDASPRLVSPWLVLLLMLQIALVFLVLPPVLVFGMVVNAPPAAGLWLLSKIASKRQKDEATVKVLFGLLAFPATWLAAGVFAARAHDHLETMYPILPNRGGEVLVLTVALAILGGMMSLRYLRVVRETARAVRVRLTRARARVAMAHLRVERSELYDAVVELVGDLDLPGAVSDQGKVVDEDHPDARFK